MLDNKTVIIGYSGHAYVVAESYIANGGTISFYADLKEAVINPFDLEYLGFEFDPNFKGWDISLKYILGIGDNNLREKVAKLILSKSKNLENVIDSYALISKSANIGNGVYASKGVLVNAFSTIGNFSPHQAKTFFQNCAQHLKGGALLLGVDLIKSPDVLHAAYNDAQCVTAAFNLNLLARANRELGCDFDVTQFAHSAFYNAPLQRIEMHLLSLKAQTVHLKGKAYVFHEGETLHTEYSHKFTIAGVQQAAQSAGLQAATVWTDPQHLFGLLWLDIPHTQETSS